MHIQHTLTQNASSQAIGITLGEPAGIGPDILLMLATSIRFTRPLVAITATQLLKKRATLLGLKLNFIEVQESELSTLASAELGNLYVLNIAFPDSDSFKSITPGTPSIQTAAWVLHTIKTATLLCLNQQLGAMVTGPVHKAIINEAGMLFTGHTEYIADRLSEALQAQLEPTMMLTSGQILAWPLRVALVTTHHPLQAVSTLITQERVFEKIQTLHLALQTYYGIHKPKIIVAGLNPHAGESGHLGLEDMQAIAPAIMQARQQGINAIGPLPADTLFTPRHLQDSHAVLAMYHDQGLPVLKYACFGSGINVTLGLPIVRTSVDHGTAFELAGTLKADASSLRAAIDEADAILTRAHFLT